MGEGRGRHWSIKVPRSEPLSLNAAADAVATPHLRVRGGCARIFESNQKSKFHLLLLRPHLLVAPPIPQTPSRSEEVGCRFVPWMKLRGVGEGSRSCRECHCGCLHQTPLRSQESTPRCRRESSRDAGGGCDGRRPGGQRRTAGQGDRHSNDGDCAPPGCKPDDCALALRTENSGIAERTLKRGWRETTFVINSCTTLSCSHSSSLDDWRIRLLEASS